MRKASFQKNHQAFEFWITWYGDFISKILRAQRVVRDPLEKLEVVEALVLRVSTRWENLIEADIIASLNRDSSAYARALELRLRKHLTRDECEAMVVGHGYLDFKSVGDIKGFGRRYLVKHHNPFEGITRVQADRIDEFILMRNLLSHYSGRAWRAYENHMKQEHGMKRVPEPGAYLTAIEPNTRTWRWARYLGTFIGTSRAMLATADSRFSAHVSKTASR